MGLFGHDDEQDKRLDELETYMRTLSENVQRWQISSAQTRIELMKLKAQVDEKLSEDDFDPMILDLNEQLAEARKQYDEISDAAEESWAKMQVGAATTLANLSKNLDEVANKITEETDS